MKIFASNKKGVIGVIIIGLVAVVVSFGLGWTLASNQNQSVSEPIIQTAAKQRLFFEGESYWRLIDWESLGPGIFITDPSASSARDCGPDEYSFYQNYDPESETINYGCRKLPTDPAQLQEEVVRMIEVDALRRFNVDTKPQAMRVISDYVVFETDRFRYLPTTPETCRYAVSYEIENTVRENLSSWSDYSSGVVGVEVNQYSYLISENCGDWVINYEELAKEYGGAFFYQEPLERFNVDNISLGIRPVAEDDTPAAGHYRYHPTTPENCRYYLADYPIERQQVDELFAQQMRPDGTRGGGFGGSLDLGGWYEYTPGQSINLTPKWPQGYTFIISENCGDWNEFDQSDDHPTNQIFDHPYAH